MYSHKIHIFFTKSNLYDWKNSYFIFKLRIEYYVSNKLNRIFENRRKKM